MLGLLLAGSPSLGSESQACGREVEPNDAPEVATRVSPPLCIEGEIGAGDQDLLLLTTVQPQVWRFRIQGVSGQQTRLDIHALNPGPDPATPPQPGLRLATQTAGAEAPALLLGPGTWLLGLSVSGGAGAWRLVGEAEDLAPAAAPAAALTPATPLTGVLGPEATAAITLDAAAARKRWRLVLDAPLGETLPLTLEDAAGTSALGGEPHGLWPHRPAGPGPGGRGLPPGAARPRGQAPALAPAAGVRRAAPAQTRGRTERQAGERPAPGPRQARLRPPGGRRRPGPVALRGRPRQRGEAVRPLGQGARGCRPSALPQGCRRAGSAMPLRGGHRACRPRPGARDLPGRRERPGGAPGQLRGGPAPLRQPGAGARDRAQRRADPGPAPGGGRGPGGALRGPGDRPLRPGGGGRPGAALAHRDRGGPGPAGRGGDRPHGGGAAPYRMRPGAWPWTIWPCPRAATSWRSKGPIPATRCWPGPWAPPRPGLRRSRTTRA